MYLLYIQGGPTFECSSGKQPVWSAQELERAIIEGRPPVTADLRGPEQFRPGHLWYGPIHRAFAALSEQGQQALRSDLERLWSEHNRATDGTTHVESEYLEVIAIRG